MKPLITKVTITDFRSIESGVVELENVAALVGANESGKTNLLRAIKFVKPPADPNNPDDPYFIARDRDTRMLSSSFINQHFPKIEYEIDDISRLINDPYLKSYVDHNKIQTVTITRQGNNVSDYSIEFSIKTPPVIIENISPESLELTAEGKDSITLPPVGWQMLEDYAVYQQSIDQRVAANELRFHDPSASREFIKEKIKSEILANLKVFFWTYEEKQIIQDVVPIDQLIADPDSFPRIVDIFKLGGWDRERMTTFLQNQSSSAYNNLLRKLSKDVTAIIKTSWRQNPNLNIEITHAGTALNVLIRDNDYGTEYTQRSEGLKWFLSFLIGFRAQTEKFKDYLILFDEPGLHLHPGGQKDILNQINLLADSNQIVYSTHSIFGLDKRFPNRVKLISKEYDKNHYPLTKIKNKIDDNDILKDALLREVLGYSITDVSPISDVNLLVEGVFDRGLIQECAKKYFSEFGEGINLNEVAILACHGASDISKTAKHLVANGLRCACLYDSDQAGKISSKANDSITATFKPLIGDIVPEAVEMEDIFPTALFKEIYKDYFTKDYPADNRLKSETLDGALDEKTKVESRNREDIKHEFETCLLEGVSVYLEAHNFSDDPELKDIKQTLEKLSKLLDRLSSKNP